MIIKIKMFIIFLLLLCFSGNSQQLIPLDEKRYTDSLRNSLADNKYHDSAKINSMLLLSDFYRNLDSIQAKRYLEKAKKSVAKYPYTHAKALFTEGQYYKDRSSKKASAYYQQGIDLLEKMRHKEAREMLAEALMNKAIVEKNKKGYPYLTKVITEKSIPLLQENKSFLKLGNMYSQLGIIFTYNADFKNAEKYIDQSLSILEKNAPNSSQLFIAYMNSVSNFCYQAKGDEAKKMLAKAEKIIAPYPDSSNYSLFYYGKMLTHITKKENDEAYKAAEMGLAIAEKNNQAQLAQMFYFNQYDILSKKKQFDKAKTILEKVMKSPLIMSDFRNKKTVYGEISNISEKMGDYKDALLWSRKFAAVSDSLYQSNIDGQIKELDARFNASEKQKLLSRKELELSNKNKYMWILALLALLFLSTAGFIYKHQKNRKKIVEQREINLQQKLKEKEQNEEIKVTKAILDGEERERERVAKDLHDGLGGMLAGVKINLSTWSNSNLEENQYESFHKIIDQLDSSVSELRRITRNLMPETLLNFGLEVALRDLCEFYERANLTVDFQAMNIDGNLPLSTQTNIYRIVQELIANAVKHSSATNIFVQCSQSGNHFFITIEDNGIGIEKNDMKKTKTMGLQNLTNRVNFLKGKMDIQSGKHQGTTINIELNTNVA